MKKISFIGGDERNYLVSKMMNEKYNVFSFGFKDSVSKLEECVEASNTLVLPIPFSKDGKNLYMPGSSSIVEIDKFIEITRNKTVFVGKISKEQLQMMEKRRNKVIDVTSDVLFITRNAIPTAEGVIAKIVEHTKKTIAGSKVMVLGFGNIGKAVSMRAHALCANVFAFDINQQEVANIRLSGYNVLDEIDKNLGDMDVIVNTVPEMILDEKMLKLVRKGTFIIDVASVPGGVDFEYAKTYGYNVVHELGIPGKIAPISAAEYVKEVIEKYIN